MISAGSGPSGNSAALINKSTEKTERISAENIITSNSRQFINREQKEVLDMMIEVIRDNGKTIMFKSVYDANNDGVVDRASIAETVTKVSWSNIEGAPTEDVVSFNKMLNDSHSHDNKTVQDLVGFDANGNATKNGRPIVLPENVMMKSYYDADGDGTIDKARYAENTNWSGIMNKPSRFTPSVHTHNISDIVGKINAKTLGGHDQSYFLNVNSEIPVSNIRGLDGISVTIPLVDGGNASASYEGISTYTRILQRNDTQANLSSINPVLSSMEIGYEKNTFRKKIGNGITPWNGLPYEYSSPESVRFNIASRDFITSYYDYSSSEKPSLSLYDTSIPNVTNAQLYNGLVRVENRLFAIPYSARDVLYCNTSLSSMGKIDSINNQIGGAWWGGVAYKNFVYCAPYNSQCILKINALDFSVDYIEDENISSSLMKYSGAILGDNGKIYFVPHNSDGILEFDPETDRVTGKYGDEAYFGTNANYCKAVRNPLDGMIYFIPKNTIYVLQFDCFRKTVKPVLKINDYGVDKFCTATLAPNGLVYFIPGYGYSQMGVFDPNIYTIKFVPFSTKSYESFGDAVVAPNNKIYLAPFGSANTGFIEYNIAANTHNVFCTVSTSADRWSGGFLRSDGRIVFMPVVSTKIACINIHTTSEIDSDTLSVFNV